LFLILTLLLPPGGAHLIPCDPSEQSEPFLEVCDRVGGLRFRVASRVRSRSSFAKWAYEVRHPERCPRRSRGGGGGGGGDLSQNEFYLIMMFLLTMFAATLLTVVVFRAWMVR